MAATLSMLQHSRRRDSLKPGATVSAGLYLRLMRWSSEMYQRPEAVRVVVEPAIQPGRADRRSVKCEQTERVEEWGPTWRRRESTSSSTISDG